MKHNPIYKEEYPRSAYRRPRSKKQLALVAGGLIALVLSGAQLGQGPAVSPKTAPASDERQTLITALQGDQAQPNVAVAPDSNATRQLISSANLTSLGFRP